MYLQELSRRARGDTQQSKILINRGQRSRRRENSDVSIVLKNIDRHSKELLDLCISLRSIDLRTSSRNKDNLLIASSFHVLSTTSDKIRLDARAMFRSLNFVTSNVGEATKENL